MLGTYAGNKKSSYLNTQSPRPYLWAMTRTVRLRFPSPLIAESNALWVHPNATNPEWRSQYMYSRSDTGCEKHKGLDRVPSLEIREFMHCKRHVALLWADLKARRSNFAQILCWLLKGKHKFNQTAYLHRVFTFCIKSTGGLIQDQNGWIPQQSSCNCNSLFLAPT